MFNLDSATITGIKHAKSALSNQDYGLTGSVGDAGYMIISDGCSSGGQTDLGARILALTAQKLIHHDSFSPLLFKNALLNALQPKRDIIPRDDWLATLGVAVLQANQLKVFFVGDGHIIFKGKNGSITLITLEYTENSPHYIAYDLFNYVIPVSDNRLVISTLVMGSDGSVEDNQVDEYAALQPYSEIFDMTEIDFVAISTDGLGTSSILLNDMAKEMCAIKSLTGEFMKRRVSWVMRGIEQKPMDDLTIAAAIRSTNE